MVLIKIKQEEQLLFQIERSYKILVKALEHDIEEFLCWRNKFVKWLEVLASVTISSPKTWIAIEEIRNIVSNGSQEISWTREYLQEAEERLKTALGQDTSLLPEDATEICPKVSLVWIEKLLKSDHLLSEW
jgi:hypothetical protein